MESQKLEQRTYRVKGMGCQGCADTVQKALEKIAGVESAEVSLDEESARVRLEPGRVNDSVLAQSVEKSGYELEVV